MAANPWTLTTSLPEDDKSRRTNALGSIEMHVNGYWAWIRMKARWCRGPYLVYLPPSQITGTVSILIQVHGEGTRGGSPCHAERGPRELVVEVEGT